MSIVPSLPKAGRLLPLDGLRGIAAIGVTAYHVNPTSPFLFWAWSFVDMFFVLSGFLIGSILCRGLSDGSLSLRNFWIRRVLRLWPVYYLVLLLVALWATVSPSLHLSPKPLLQSMFFLQFTGGYLHPGADWNQMEWHFLPWFSHSWSIAVEEQFYLILPALLYFSGVRARGVFVIAAAALLLSQCLLYMDFVPYLLGTRMQGLALGLLLVPLSQWLQGAAGASQMMWRRLALIILLAGLVTGAGIMSPLVAEVLPGLWNGTVIAPEVFKNFVFGGILGMSLLYFSFVGYVIAFPNGLIARVLSTPLLVYLGSISYALYMCHVPIEGLLVSLRGRLLSDDSLWVNALFWIVVIACAVLSKQLIEDRFNNLKGRYPVFIKSD